MEFPTAIGVAMRGILRSCPGSLRITLSIDTFFSNIHEITYSKIHAQPQERNKDF